MDFAALLEKARNEPPMGSEEYTKMKVDRYNASVGNLEGYDCPECLNRGNFEVVTDVERGYTAIRNCKCMDIRRSMRQIERSGLKENMERFRFDNYEASDNWQKHAYSMAQAFLKDEKRRWFFAGGQVGGGKTHICTAIGGELLRQGIPLRYMVWDIESKKLKALVNDLEYEKAMRGWREVEALYIDDFLKTKRGSQPTDADIKLAFEIINYRYNNRDLITIISSEHYIDEIVDFDEATGSRIYEFARNYCLTVDRNAKKNYRLR